MAANHSKWRAQRAQDSALKRREVRVEKTMQERALADKVAQVNRLNLAVNHLGRVAFRFSFMFLAND